MSEFLQHLINMLVLGGTYALLGIGLTLIFGIMNVVNFTHGVLYTFGAYIMFIVVHQLGINFFLALPLAVAAGWLLGAAIELTLLRPLRGSDIDTTMLVNRRLDRDAVRRLVDMGWRGEIGDDAVP